MKSELMEWMTAREIAKLGLPGIPRSINGVHYFARAKGVFAGHPHCRKNQKPGGSGVQYHRDMLPMPIENQLEWLTAQEIIDLQIEGLPTGIDELQAKFRREGVEQKPHLFRRMGHGSALLYHRSLIEDHSKWLRPREIAQMRLPGFPVKSNSVTRYMKQIGLFGNPKYCRKSGANGGGFEYHIDALPPEAKQRLKKISRNSPTYGPRTRFRLERRPLGRLAETFPDATEIRFDLKRARERRLIVRVPAPSRPHQETEPVPSL